MSVASILVEHLSGGEALREIIGDRLFRNKRNPTNGDPLPKSAVFDILEDADEEDIAGAPLLQKITVGFFCYGGTDEEADVVADAVRTRMYEAVRPDKLTVQDRRFEEVLKNAGRDVIEETLSLSVWVTYIEFNIQLR